MNSEVKQNNIDFSLIRYSQCWEDVEILLKALDIKEGDICFGIASAGDNVLSMLTENPKKIIAIDVSFPQIALMKLKIAAIRNFDYEKMLMFTGATDNSENLKQIKNTRLEMYRKIKNTLDFKTRQYWDFNIEAIKTGIIHIGKFEKFFKIFRTKILPFIHSKKKVNQFLEEKTKRERIEFYEKKWNNWRWQFMFKIFFSNYVVGKLGRDPEFFKYAKKNLAVEMAKQLKFATTEQNPSENPYLCYILKGNYKKNLLPYFLREENFYKIKQNIDKIEIVENSVEEYLSEIDFCIDKFNLSDIFEYMSLKNYENLMNIIYENANKNAILAYWNMIVERNSEMIDFNQKYLRLTKIDGELHKKDKTFFYTDFVVEKVMKGI